MGSALAQRSKGPGAVEAGRWVLRSLTRTIWPLRARLARNMKLAGVYRKGLVPEHFDRAVDHLVMMAHIFRAGIRGSGCLERFRFDASLDHVREARARGKGGLIIAPHLCGFPVLPAVVNQQVPCHLYIRRNKDEAKMAINRAVGRAADTNLVCPPPDATRAQRLQVAVDALRAGHLLYVTPDLPWKSHEGTAVSIFGRTTYFPTGVFVMAMRTGAAVVPAWWRWDNGAYSVRFDPPVILDRGGGVKSVTEAAMRTWAAHVDAFLRAEPAMWWNWLDNRWTALLRRGTTSGVA